MSRTSLNLVLPHLRQYSHSCPYVAGLVTASRFFYFILSRPHSKRRTKQKKIPMHLCSVFHSALCLTRLGYLFGEARPTV